MNKFGKILPITILVIALVAIIIIIELALAWIQFNRFLFWFDLIFMPISLVALVISIIFIFKSEEFEREDWYIIGAISGGIFILTLITINGAYNNGYSEQAIKTKAELENQLSAYTLMLSIYTGQFEIHVQGMVAEKFTKALCEAAPQTPCEQVIEGYNAYNELVGWKESADAIAKIWKGN